MQDTIQETTIERPRGRWSKAHSIWLLISLSLLPAVLLAAACFLIVRGGEER